MTRQQAINAKCKDCIYDDLDAGTWREQISNCLDIQCALYEFRPLSQSAKLLQKQERLANMTPEELAIHEEKAAKARAILIKNVGK